MGGYSSLLPRAPWKNRKKVGGWEKCLGICGNYWYEGWMEMEKKQQGSAAGRVGIQCSRYLHYTYLYLPFETAKSRSTDISLDSDLEGWLLGRGRPARPRRPRRPTAAGQLSKQLTLEAKPSQSRPHISVRLSISVPIW